MFKYIVRHGSVLTFGSTLAGLLNYGFVLLAARGLGPEDFGSLGVLLTFFYLAAALVQGIQTLTAQNVAEGSPANKRECLTRVIRSGSLTVSKYSLLILIVYFLVSASINEWLHIGSTPAIIVVGIVCVIRAVSGVFRGALQGVDKFSELAGVRAAEAGFRFLLALALFIIGFTLLRTVLVYLLSAVILVVGPVVLLPIDWRELWGPSYSQRKGRVTKRALFTGAAFCLLAALTQIDMLAAKYYLSADTAGHYAAASNLVKAPFSLIAGSFATVMFPSVVRSGATTGRGLKLLGQTTGAVATLLAVTVGGCYFLSEQIIVITLGVDYGPLAEWLLLFAAAVCAPALLFVVSRYYMVSHGSVLLKSLVAGLVAIVMCLAFFHATHYQIIFAMLIGSLIPLLALTAHALTMFVRISKDAY